MNLLTKLKILMVTILVTVCNNVYANKPPNIIFIMIDDLGYGDLECYGSENNKTPFINQLAEKGIRFTDFHSNGSVCSPTRAAFMTGRYQHRLGKDFEGALGFDDKGLPLESFTIAEALKEAGYATAVYGKWHLGLRPPFLPHDQGFDDFWGLGFGDGDHFTHINRRGESDWWHNNSMQFEKGYTADLITKHSIDFIKSHADKPFFLYVSHLAIHFPWQGPEDPPHRREGINYTKDKVGIIPDKNNVRKHVKGMIERIDEGVGKMIKTLDSLKLSGNTLVVFTSDNGGYIHYGNEYFNISSNGPLKGQKGQIHEGGHQVPFIVYWPGKIKPGQVSNEIGMTMDMFPTFAEMAGYKIPRSLKIDGVSLLPHLLKGVSLPPRCVYWKQGTNMAIRKKEWKLCVMNDKKTLYNLDQDIEEQNDLANSLPGMVNQLWKECRKWENDVTTDNSLKR